MSPQRILERMEAGPMVAMTQLRTPPERRAIARVRERPRLRHAVLDRAGAEGDVHDGTRHRSR